MMSILEASMMHHVCIVLLLLCLLSSFDYCHPVAYFFSLIYLYLVHERYCMRLRRKLQFEERRQANRRRVLSDSETVRWLNHAVEKIWPICMEHIASQKILLPIIPWFLEKYKPWTAKQATVQQLYLGRNPPIFTGIRVLREPTDDDHLVLELGMNFLTADDMGALLAVKLRKRLGFGMWAKLHMTGMHVEGKVLIGVKFLRKWPFLGRLRVCFVEPPYFQMTVKPIFTHGLDATELPGIAGWIDKLLSIAFEQTLVEPNMLVVDMEKFASQQLDDWFFVDEKEPVAYAKVEVVEASDLKPSDLNGLADPYVKGQLGQYRFKTKIQKKTLFPKWHEEFKIPICTWESPNLLAIEVCDKDHFVDDTLGHCSVNISDLRDSQRHDMWLPLGNVKTGRLRLAITVLDDTEKEDDKPLDVETLNQDDKRNSFASETAHKDSFSPVSSDKSPKLVDHYEPIDVEGKQKTGIWVQKPGSEVTQIWEPRKGKSRRLDTQIHSGPNESFANTSSATSGPLNNDSSSTEDNQEYQPNKVRRGLQKIGSVFHRSPKADNYSSTGDAIQSPNANSKGSGVKFIVEDSLSVPASDKVSKEESLASSGESPDKGNVKGIGKSILKKAGQSARSIKHTLSRKASRLYHRGDSPVVGRDTCAESDSSEDESFSSPKFEMTPVISNPASSQGIDSYNSKEHIVHTGASNPAVVSPNN